MILEKDFRDMQERYLNNKLVREDFAALVAEVKRLKDAVIVANARSMKLQKKIDLIGVVGKKGMTPE